jgi:hypothetical protein
VPHEHGALHAERVHEREHVGGEVTRTVAVHWSVGIAVASLIRGVDAVLAGEIGQDPAEGERGVRQAVEQNHHGTGRVALLEVAQSDAGGEPYIGDPRA